MSVDGKSSLSGALGVAALCRDAIAQLVIAEEDALVCEGMALLAELKVAGNVEPGGNPMRRTIVPRLMQFHQHALNALSFHQEKKP